MPIKNLTDRNSVTPRFTRLGIIRKGEKVGDGRETELVDLDYFRFVSDRPEVIEAFSEAYGAQPVRIRCFLPYQTMEENWQTWMEEWGYSGLIHRCDGEIMVQWLNGDKSYTRDYEQVRQALCPYACGEKERTPKNPGCSEVGRLSIIIPELLQVGFFGYVTVETHSIHDLANITNSIVEAENKAREFGCVRGLQGIGFVLRRQFEEVGIRYQKKNGDFVKTRGNKWMIRLDPAREWALRQMEIAQASAFALPTPAPAALPQEVIIDSQSEAIASLPEIIEETGEIVQPERPSISPQIMHRWHELAEEAQSLNLEFDDLPENVATEQIIELGRELAGRIEEAKQEPPRNEDEYGYNAVWTEYESVYQQAVNLGFKPAYISTSSSKAEVIAATELLKEQIADAAVFDPSQIEDGIKAKEFYALVQKHIPYYRNKNHIFNAYKKIDPDTVLCQPTGEVIKPREVWVLLAEYANAPKEGK